MDMTHDTDITPLERALRASADAPAEGWERLRRDLAAEAERAGLLDVAFERHDTPLGTIVVGATRDGVVRIGLPSEREEDVLQHLADGVSPRVLHGSRDALRIARAQLDEYFARDRRSFEVPLDWRLARGFRRAVLEAAEQIPYGRTATYRDVATSAGSPNAVRAAGTALATNPLPIVVPCHRVVRTGGGLGQYRGGSAAKAALLALEAAA
jgi:methylated-DNA-[protein]-cysteine S-methyltransferase